MSRSSENKPFKVVFVGDAKSGKTALATRLIHDPFTDTYTSTVGQTWLLLPILSPRYNKLWMVDTAGNPKFKEVTSIAFRNPNVIILTYDLSSQESFESLQSWLDLCDEKNKMMPPILLVGCQSDKKNVVDEDSIQQFKEDNQIQYAFKTSAKTSKGIAQLNNTITSLIQNNWIALPRAEAKEMPSNETGIVTSLLNRMHGLFKQTSREDTVPLLKTTLKGYGTINN